MQLSPRPSGFYDTALDGHELDVADKAMASIDRYLSDFGYQLVGHEWESLHAQIGEYLVQSTVTAQS